MNRPLLVMVGVAGTSRIDVLGMTADANGDLLLAAGLLGIPVAVEGGRIQRWDAEPWTVEEAVRSIVDAASARVWRWRGDADGEWERDRLTRGQARSESVEVVHVTTRLGKVELEVLGGPAAIVWLLTVGTWRWPVRTSELPAIAGSLVVECGANGVARASRQIHEMLGDRNVREWTYSATTRDEEPIP